MNLEGQPRVNARRLLAGRRLLRARPDPKADAEVRDEAQGVRHFEHRKEPRPEAEGISGATPPLSLDLVRHGAGKAKIVVVRVQDDREGVALALADRIECHVGADARGRKIDPVRAAARQAHAHLERRRQNVPDPYPKRGGTIRRANTAVDAHPVGRVGPELSEGLRGEQCKSEDKTHQQSLHSTGK